MPGLLPTAGRFPFFADLRPDLIIEGELDVDIVGLVIHEIDGTIRDEDGEQRPTLIYFVLELDGHGRVVDDWAPIDLDTAKAFLPDGATWESLPVARDDAVAYIASRFAT